MSSSVYEIKEVVLNDDNEPMVLHDGNILCHIVNKEGETDTVAVAPDLVNSLCLRSPSVSDGDDEKRDEWSDEQTRFILDKYFEYLPLVGPMKRFRLKKDMWVQISHEINEKYKCSKIGAQVENRYKTVMKRKKKAVDNNQQSGSKRQKVEFEEEVKKISSIDDSIEPEVLQDQASVIIKEKPEKVLRKKSESVVAFLKKSSEEKKHQREQHHKEKEENKERRHREKMDLLRELFKKE